MSEEKRKHKRVPTDFLVRARVTAEGEIQEGVCRNLSTGGLFIQMEEPLPMGTSIYLELELEPIQRIVRTKGVVVWVRPKMPDPNFPSGVGVRFEELDEEAFQLIESLVETLTD